MLQKTTPFSPEEILDMVCKDFNVDPADVTNGTNNKQVAQARRIAALLIDGNTDLKRRAIAAHVGFKNWGNISEAVAFARSLEQADVTIGPKIRQLRNKIHAGKEAATS